MAKIKKGLIVRIDQHFSLEQRTQERYKKVAVKIIEADDENIVGKEATLYMNKHTNAELIMAIQKNVYLHNFLVEKQGCCSFLINQKKLPDDFFCTLDGERKITDRFLQAMNVGAEYLGPEYAKAMGKVYEVRMARFSQYGNSYLNDSYSSLINQIKDKIKRVEINLGSGGTDYENQVDSAIDAVNYSIFVLAKTLKETDEQ